MVTPASLLRLIFKGRRRQSPQALSKGVRQGYGQLEITEHAEILEDDERAAQ